jgi:hypothetical protein
VSFVGHAALALVGITHLRAENAGNVSSGDVESLLRTTAMRIGQLEDGPSPCRCRGGVEGELEI